MPRFLARLAAVYLPALALAAAAVLA